MKLPFPSFLKRQLTTLQITQFLIGGSLAASYLFIQLPTFEASSLVEALSVGELTQASVVRMGTQCVVATGQRLAVWLNVVYLIPLSKPSLRRILLFRGLLTYIVIAHNSLPLRRVLLQILQSTGQDE